MFVLSLLVATAPQPFALIEAAAGSSFGLAETALAVVAVLAAVAAFLALRAARRLARRSEVLLTRERVLLELVERSGDWAFELDAQGVTTRCGPECHALLGFEPEEVIGRPCEEMLVESDRERVRQLFFESASAVRPMQDVRVQLLDSNGEPVDFECNAVPRFDDSGAFVGFRGVHRDVSGRARLTDALNELVDREQRYQAVFEASPVGLWEEDWNGVARWLAEHAPGGVEELRAYLNANPDALGEVATLVRITAVNRTGLEIVGASSIDELIGSLDQLLTEEALEVFRNELFAFVAGEEDFVAETTCPTLSGEIKRIALGIRILPREEPDADWKVIVSTHDVTDRRVAEEERAVLEARLRQGRRMEALGTLARGFVGDFNNLLLVVQGHTELARDSLSRREDAEADRHLVSIEDAIERTAGLVRRIQAFSRAPGVERTPLAARSLIQEELVLAGEVASPDVEIVSSLEDVGSIRAGEGELERIVGNLVENATQAEGTTRIDVKLERVDWTADDAIEIGGPPAGPCARLAVHDDGEGMPPEVLERALDPFFSTRGSSVGAGLGLPVVHGIASDLGGTLRLTSEVGGGTTAEVLLPIAPGDDDDDLLVPFRGEEGARRLRVLVVDDEPALVELAETVLTRLGFDAVGQCDPRAALDLLHGDPSAFDLMLTDQRMPDLSGLELATEAHALRPALPIVLATGMGVFVASDELAGAGVDAVLRKPYQSSELARVLGAVLSSRGVGVSPA